MLSEDLDQVVSILTKGDTAFAEELFTKPAGKKYFQHIVLIIINTLPYEQEEKEELFEAFTKISDKIQARIIHQKKGLQILAQVDFKNGEKDW